LHLFDKTQADLNWENANVRAAIYDAMRFWLDRGIGGFRLDVVTLVSKPIGLPDIPFVTLNQFYGELAKGPRLFEFLREMRREVFAHYDCVAIGEAPGVDPALAARLVDPADPMLDLLYHFDLVDPPRTASGDWDRIAFKRVFSDWNRGIGARGWNTIVLSNHDLGRIVSRFGDEKLRYESATCLAALVLLQRGTPFLYQGDELGLVNCPFPNIEALDDVWAKTTYRLALEGGATQAEAFAKALAMTRDHARWPMPWDMNANAGFSAGAPWLQLHPDAAQMSASAQEADAGSVLAFVRKLIALRTSDPVWTEGSFTDLAPDDPDLFAFERRLGDRAARVVLNLRNKPTPAPDWADATSSLSNISGDSAQLTPWEARIHAGGTSAV
jgi:oligo-1,6-glucosidase